MKIYAMSDIHGCYEAFLDALNLIDLSDKNTKLILLGDYIHGGDGGYKVIEKIISLQKKYGTDKVMALMGNHEEWIIEQNMPIVDEDRNEGEFEEKKEAKFIEWMERLSLYYFDENRLFCHAGVDEEAGEYWEAGTSDYWYTGKFPASIGKFCVDIIAGHISTASITNNPKYKGIYFDGYSHYYIDGDVLKNGYIPILMVDTKTNKYYEITESGKQEIE